MANVKAVLGFLARNCWRATVAVAGFVVLAVGVIMLVTPGPGLVVIIAGLAILATQFAWAERALDRAKAKAAQAKQAALRRARRQPSDPGRTPAE
jgi:uncharacterized protein (TIGR02611 family)